MTGAILAPNAAPVQVVGVPIVKSKSSEEDAENVRSLCSETIDKIGQAGIRAKYDGRTYKNPGWKYNYWEQKGNASW